VSHQRAAVRAASRQRARTSLKLRPVDAGYRIWSLSFLSGLHAAGALSVTLAQAGLGRVATR